MRTFPFGSPALDVVQALHVKPGNSVPESSVPVKT
jgi:hypothetical protein